MLPLKTVTVPELLKLPEVAVVRVAFPESVRAPVLLLNVDNALLAPSRIFALVPVNVRFAALVVMLPLLLANCIVPPIVYVPPVRVPALRLVRLPVTVNVLPLFTVSVPESVKLPAAVKLALLASVKLPVLEIAFRLPRALALVVEFTSVPVPFSVMLAASV